ncbi:dihydroorotase [Prochlorococcus sp. MIT 1223]|uniref:dihydroorotase n=1 Tax=Prochlorococcus sp. MIT 1223 TaxID=3096217 RepID=UPI002A750F4F|nr:dihydroorotase [Prochlorococcus sp. MIT 1223]
MNLFDPIQILYGSNEPIVKDAVLISNGKIKAFGEQARLLAKKENVKAKALPESLIAPCLVDPHSFLLNPLTGKNESLKSLRKKAAKSGYGQLALLPRASIWRDKPELLQNFKDSSSDVDIHLWGAFSMGGQGIELSSHKDLIEHGAIGIAEDDYIPPIHLLRKSLLANEIGKYPLLLAPRDIEIQGTGIVREGVDTLRAGWPPDPIESEAMPLCQLIELQKRFPDILLRLMNISTATAVEMISESKYQPLTSVNWWHIVSDNSNLNPAEIGWRVSPSLGNPKDRARIKQGFLEGTLSAIAVNSIALDFSKTKGNHNERMLGVSGHHLVLPSLWNELIVNSNWTIKQLWNALSFGPSRMLNLPEESLEEGSRRWLIFDPHQRWIQTIDPKDSRGINNEPFEGKHITGKIIHCGLNA